MALTYEESVKFEELKQSHKRELNSLNEHTMTMEHQYKKERLGLLLNIAEAGGKIPKEDD